MIRLKTGEFNAPFEFILFVIRTGATLGSTLHFFCEKTNKYAKKNQLACFNCFSPFSFLNLHFR